MRSVLACLTAGVLTVALASATPARAETSAPTFSPNPVVLGSGPHAVSGTVEIEEPSGLTFQSARVYDPSCLLTWDSLPVDASCQVWLHDVATSKSGDVRSVDLSGEIPLRDGTGSLVDGPTTYVTFVYADGSHEYLETGLDVVAGQPAPPPVPTPATRPSAPRRQHATAAPGRATLYWAYPATNGGATINRYQVRRGTSSFARNLSPTARRFTFTHLRNGSLYRLYVRAHNAKGFSGWVAARARPQAPPRPRDYAGCAGLNRVYPHGVGRPGARDRGGSVTTFTRSLATYRLNTEDDRDRDGIACEKR